MRKTLPVYTVPVLRGPAAQALFDAEEALTAAHVAVEPDARTPSFGLAPRSVLTSPPSDVRHRVMLSSERAPLVPDAMIDDTSRAVVADARAAMRSIQGEEILVLHFPDGIAVIATHGARVATSRRALLSRTRLIVPFAPGDAAAIARHDALQKMSRAWIDMLRSLNPGAATGLACPCVDCLLGSPALVKTAA